MRSTTIYTAWYMKYTQQIFTIPSHFMKQELQARSFSGKKLWVVTVTFTYNSLNKNKNFLNHIISKQRLLKQLNFKKI